MKALAFSFKGGIHPEYNKERTFAKAIETLPAPEEIIIPLLQHVGGPCEALVKVGDDVTMGQKIGDSNAPVSCPVHSSVSGTVKAIEPRWHSSGVKVKSIVIENDFEDRQCEECIPYEGDLDELTSDEIINYSRAAGIVGMGGAAFPLHVKLKTALEKRIDMIIINGSECEPYITSDHRAMIEYPRPIASGIKLVMQCLGVKDAILAIEADKPDAIAAMQTTCEDLNIHVVSMPTKYPQGGEKQIIKAITGREIPPGKLPMDIGCAVFNVDTCASLYRCITTGLPLIRRIVTVSGSAVNTPNNLLTRIGTSFYKLFEYCGGFIAEPYKLICGGPMMGNAHHTLDTPVIKNTNALLAFCGEEESFSDVPTCIRCGRCVSACPMRLMPNYLYMYAEKGEFEKCKKMNVEDCIECGCCSYVCPGKLYLVQAMRMAKGNINR